MKISIHAAEREEILAHALSPVAYEMRLLDAADLISLLRFEYRAGLNDLIASAAELYFHPGTIRLGSGGDYSLDWGTNPTVTIDLEITPRGMKIYAKLVLTNDHAAVEIDYIEFDQPMHDAETATALMAESLEDARLRKPGMSFLPKITSDVQLPPLN